MQEVVREAIQQLIIIAVTGECLCAFAEDGPLTGCVRMLCALAALQALAQPLLEFAQYIRMGAVP